MPYINDKGNLRVAVLGAAGGIGQSLSLLLKTQLGSLLQGGDHSDDRLELALYDIAADLLAGVTADLSHINTPVVLKNYVPSSREDTSALDSCLEGASVVVIPAGVPRKPGMTRDDLISINAKIVGGLAAGIARACDLSGVFVLVISNPVNSLVPVVLQEIIKHADTAGTDSAGIERRVFGVTQLDLVRASTFIQQLTEYDGNRIPEIPVIGGHSGETIVPLFGRVQRELGFSDEQRAKLVHRVQYGGDEIVEAKKGAGSATLSMAYAGYQITASFVELLLGNSERIKVTVYAPLVGRDGKPVAKGAEEVLDAIDGIQYFAVPVEVEAGAGVIKVDSSVLQEMDEYDRDNLLPVCLDGLRKNIEKGLSLAS